MRATLPVRSPYRLDLTVNALRRVSTNVVDVMTPDRRYMRALTTHNGITIVDVRQRNGDELDVRISGPNPRSRLLTVARMLGTDVELRTWYQRTKALPWLATLAERLRGVKPPRYPELWEALCHGIIFQQLSIVAASAIMQRLVERFTDSVEHDGVTLYPFPRPEMILDAPANALQALGLSRMKASYLKNAAEAIAAGTVSAERIEALTTSEATAELCRLRGIGPWSAAVILLRGFGRLDVFPLNDSGVLQSIKALSGNQRINVERVLSTLGDMRGMLYFHLLLGRMQTR